VNRVGVSPQTAIPGRVEKRCPGRFWSNQVLAVVLLTLFGRSLILAQLKVRRLLSAVLPPSSACFGPKIWSMTYSPGVITGRSSRRYIDLP